MIWRDDIAEPETTTLAPGEVWTCRYCGWVYLSPVEDVADVWHLCPARRHEVRHLRREEVT